MRLNWKENPVIGMVHTLPLPGSENYESSMDEIVKRATEEAITLTENGVDAIMIENMLDVPFAEMLETEQTVALTRVAQAVREVTDVPLGINAAFNDYRSALAIAHVTNAQFVRIPVFVDTMVYAGGVIHPCAREALQYRKKLGANSIQILADIQVKHAYSLAPAMPIEESAVNALTCGADGVIVTGVGTGSETPMETIEKVKSTVPIPVFIGSGVNKDNIQEQLSKADGAIVGSSLKPGKDIGKPVDKELTRALIAAKGDAE